MSNISKNILDKIEQDQVKPKPKWQFVVMHVLLIVTFLLCLWVGGAVMGLIFLKVNNVDWDLLNRVEANFWEFLPAIWFALLLLMLLLAKKVFSMMEGSYRIQPVILIGAAVAISLLLGGAIYFTKAADFLETSLRQNVPLYMQMESDATAKFVRPDKGVLPGKIITAPVVGQTFSLEDLSGKEWNVMYSTEAQPVRMIKIGQPVMVLGTQVDETNFQAEQIRVKPPVFTIIRKIEPVRERIEDRREVLNELRLLQEGTVRLERVQELREGM
jgi:hypothetical protein